jgi:hypothetical protein
VAAAADCCQTVSKVDGATDVNVVIYRYGKLGGFGRVTASRSRAARSAVRSWAVVSRPVRTCNGQANQKWTR